MMLSHARRTQRHRSRLGRLLRGDRRRQRLPHRRLLYETLEDRQLLAVITVDSLLDGPVDFSNGQTTLREALALANDGDTIQIQPTGTIRLTEGELHILSDVTIQGNGVIIDAQQQSRVIWIGDAPSPVEEPPPPFWLWRQTYVVTLEDLTITNGFIKAEERLGAGIGSNATDLVLSLKDCHVVSNQIAELPDDRRESHNHVIFGGGIGVYGGSVSIRNSSLIANSAGDGAGGAFGMLPGIGWFTASVELMDTDVMNNSAGGHGNRGNWSGGGGIFVGFHGASLTVRNSRFVNNTAHTRSSIPAHGGAIHAADVSISDCEFLGNRADHAGAVYQRYDEARITNSVFRDNEGDEGSAIGAKSLFLADSILVGNRRGDFSWGYDINGTIRVDDSAVVTRTLVSSNDDVGINAYYGSLTLTDSDVMGNTGAGIIAEVAEIHESTVSRNGSTGVSAENITVSDSSISQNLGSGISGDLAVVQNSVIAANRGGGIGCGSLRITDSRVEGNSTAGDGGGIRAWTIDLLTNTTVFRNDAKGDGGGIYVHSGNLYVNNSTIAGNNAEGHGGGIFRRLGGNQETKLEKSRVVDNSAGMNGGGIYGRTTSYHSQILRNHAGGSGGGIFGSVTLHHSTLAGNVAEQYGGGVSGSLTAHDTTVVGNTAQYGGGVYGNFDLRKTRVSGNIAEVRGGGLYQHSSWGRDVLVSSHVVGNQAHGQPETDCPRNPDGTNAVESCSVEDWIETAGGDIWSSGLWLSMDWSEANDIYHGYRQVQNGRFEDPVVAVLKPAESVPFGGHITIDASLSHNATQYAWDLNGDGDFEDASDEVVQLPWEQAEALGFRPGPNRVQVQVTDDQGNTDEATGTIVVETEEDPHPEWLARVLAYGRGREGDPFAPVTVTSGAAQGIGYGYYVVDAVFGDPAAGFYAMGLARSESAPTASRDPILVIRGTELVPLDIWDVIADLNPEGVGYNQFIVHAQQVYNWFDKWGDERVDIVGHSLGGALAQWFAAGYTSLGGQLGKIITYNATGISRSMAEEFRRDAVHSVVHHIVNGDMVSMFGEAFIEGTNVFYEFSSWNLLKKHSVPLELDEIEDRVRPADLRSREIASSTLNSRWFHFDDRAYLFTLLVGSVLLPTEQLFFRYTAEKLRQDIGKHIPIIHSPSFQSFFGQDHVAPTTSFAINIPWMPIPFAPGFDLHDIRVVGDATKHTLTASATLTVSSVVLGVRSTKFAVTVDVGLFKNQVNMIGVTSDKMNVPLFATGAFLQKIGAKLEHFSEHDERPVRFTGTMGLSFGPVVGFQLPRWLGGRKFEAKKLTMEGSIAIASLEDFKLAGKIVLVHPMILEADGQLRYEANAPLYSLLGTASTSMLAGIGQANLETKLGSPNGFTEFHAHGSSSLRLPRSVPLIGGSEMAAAARIEFLRKETGFDARFWLEGATHVPFRGLVQIGLEIASDGTFRIWGFRRVSEADAARYDKSMVVVSWDQDAEGAQGTLVLPDGTRIAEADLEARQDIALVESMSHSRQRAYAVERPPADVLGWTVEMAGVDGPVSQDVYVVSQPPGFNFDAVRGGAGEPLEVEFSLADADSPATVAFYLESVQNPGAPYPIARGLSASDSPFVWSPTDLPSGSYRLLAFVEDGYSVPIRVDADTVVQVETTPSVEVAGGVARGPAEYSLSFSQRISADWAPETRRFTIRNEGSGPLILSPTDTLASDNSAFHAAWVGPDGQTFPLQTVTLAVDQTIDLAVSLVAQLPGRRDVSLHLETNDPQRPEIVLSAAGSVVTPAAELQRTVSDRQPVSFSFQELLNVPHGLQGGNIRVLTATPTLRTHGALQIQQDRITLTPERGFRSGTFTYLLADDQGGLATCAVHVDVDNPHVLFDVNDDGVVSPLDVLLIINAINQHGAGRLPPLTADNQHLHWLDVNGDGILSALDALMVINHLNVHSDGLSVPPATGEGEEATTSDFMPVSTWTAFPHDPFQAAVRSDSVEYSRTIAATDAQANTDAAFADETAWHKPHGVSPIHQDAFIEDLNSGMNPMECWLLDSEDWDLLLDAGPDDPTETDAYFAAWS